MKLSKFLVLLILIPSVANASWWNPVSWFSKKTEVTKTLPVRSEKRDDSALVISTSTKKENQEQTVPTTSIVTNSIDETKIKKVKITVIKQGVIKKENISICDDTCKGEKIQQENVKKEKDILAKQGKQKCLDGSMVSTNETCSKTCGDGEIVAENLKCRTERVTQKTINSRDVKNSDTESALWKKMTDLEKYKYLVREQAENELKKTGFYSPEYIPEGWSNNRSREEVKTAVDWAYDKELTDYAEKLGKRRCEDNTLIPLNKMCANPKELASLIEQYNQIQRERSNNSSSGTGLYGLKEGVQYSPDQIMSQRRSADSVYDTTLELIIPKIIRLQYYNDPVTAKQMLDDFRYGQLEDTINSLNKKIDSVKSKQNQIQGCIKDLTTGGYGYGCN